MGQNSNWYDIGNEIRNAVEGSLRTGDFTKLGDVLTDTINDVVDEAKLQAKKSYEQRANTKTVYIHQAPPQKKLPKVLFKRKGDISGILLTVFGGIGTGTMGIGILIIALLAILGLAKSIVSVFEVIFGSVFFGSIAMIYAGISARKRLQRAERYVALSQNHTYVNISDLAKCIGKSENYVRRDVKKMIAKGLFPQGHLDDKETCLILSDDMYSEYRKLEYMRREYDKKEISQAIVKEATNALSKNGKNSWSAYSGIEAPSESLKTENPELYQMILEGRECTGHIRHMNEQIPGEVISRKLDELERVLTNIFKRVGEQPEQIGKMQKFMEYYLPTTLKLVEAYEEFDAVENPGEEIIEAKLELEKTLDTINQSFEELYQQMFSDKVFDVTTDAQVLKTMLAKDGLAKDHAFDANKK